MTHLKLFSAALCALAISPGALAQTPGQNINMVSGITFPTGDPYLQRQNEPSIAVSSRNSSHLMAGDNDYRSVNIPAPPGVTDETGDAWVGVFKSFDGGQTWQSTLLPGYPQDTSPEGLASPLHGFTTGADPIVRAGTSGTFYYSGIAFNRGTNIGSVFVARFIDLANKENGDPIKYLGVSIIDSGGSGQFLDKPWLAVDIPRGSASCTISTTQNGQLVSQTIPAGNAYIAYSAFVGGTNNVHTQILVASSADCGQTWSKPTKVSESYQLNQGSTMAIDPQTGNIYVAWRQFSTSSAPNAINISESTDGGKSFSKAITVQSLPDFNAQTPAAPSFFDQGISTTMFRTNAYPALAVDGTGRVYLAWSQRGVNANSDARIVLTSSTDGVSWTPPAPIDNAALVDAAQNSFTRGSQLMPSLEFTGGKLMALYYDLRLDHTAGRLTPNDPFVPDATGEFYQQTQLPLVNDTGAADSPAAIETPFVSDAGLNVRHTLDVRVAQADPAATPAFQSTSVSQYPFGTLGAQQPATDLRLHQLQVNPPNLPMFAGGTVPFMGDYIEIAGRTFLTPGETGAGWAFNASPSGSADGFATWTTNQDVRPPANGDWTQTTSPDCPVAPTLDGSRDQNIYFSRVTQGFSFTTPQPSKPLSSTLQRAFVLDLFNSTDQQRTFQLTIENQPAGGTASFAVAPTPIPAPLPAPLTLLNVTLPPRSGATRSVFALSTNPTASIQIQADEIPNPGSTSVSGTPHSGFVVLNADPAVNALVNPDSSPADIAITELYTPTLSNLNIANPNVSLNISNLNISNPSPVNLNIANLNIANLNIANLNIANPSYASLNIANVNVANLNISNSTPANLNIANLNISNAPVSDVNYTVTNSGNTNTAYQVKLVQLAATPANVPIQLILSKNYTTLVANKCQPAQQQNTSIPIANITNPTTISYTEIGLNSSNAPAASNATLHLAPGESGLITIRAFTDLNTVQSIASNIIPAVRAEAAVTDDNLYKLAVPLTLVPIALTNAIVGSAYSTSFAYFGGTAPYTWSVSTGGLPPGLTLDPTSGVLSGSPTTPGTYSFAVQIADAAQNTTTRGFSLVVVSPVKITTATIPDGVVNAAYSTSVAATGGLGALTWSVSAGALPSGLTLSSTTGSITGSATTAGSYPFTITVSDTSSPALSAQQTFTLRIAQPIAITSPVLPDAVVGKPYSFTLTSTGGTSPDTWTVTSGSLPAGLTLTSAGLLSGTPISASPTGSSFTLTLSDSASPAQTLSSSFTLRVASPLTITTTALRGGDLNASYSASLAASGGLGVDTWSVSSGSLPTGLTLNAATGLISGTPTTAGSFSFTIRVTDSSSPIPLIAQQSFTILIAQPLAFAFTSLPDAVVGKPYSFALTATGGTSPDTWSISSGALPAGLSLSPSGIISGTPTTAPGTSFTLTLIDSALPAQSRTSSFSLRVAIPLAVTTLSIPNPQIGIPYSATLTATGGNAPLAWSIISGSLPGGLSLATATGVLSGTPTTPGTFGFTARVTDSSIPAQTASQAYTVTVPNPLSVSFLVEPSNTSPNTQITPSIKVQVLNANGQAVSGATVVLTLQSNPGGGILSGTTAASTNDQGIALFAYDYISASGTGYTLRATATVGSTQFGFVISTPFNVR